MMRSLILLAGILLAAPVNSKETKVENGMRTYSDQWEEVRNNNGVVSYVRWLHYDDNREDVS